MTLGAQSADAVVGAAADQLGRAGRVRVAAEFSAQRQAESYLAMFRTLIDSAP